MDPKTLSPDLKQMYEKVMSTPVKSNAQTPPTPPPNTKAYSQPIPPRKQPDTLIIKDIPAAGTQSIAANQLTPQRKNSGIVIIGLSIIFFMAYAFFWLVFFGIISRSTLGI